VLARYLSQDVLVLCAWHEEGQPNMKIQHRLMRVYVTSVRELLPQPNMYRHVLQVDMPLAASNIAGVRDPVEQDTRGLYDLTVAAAEKLAELNGTNSETVAQYAVGVSFASGDRIVCPDSAASQKALSQHPVDRVSGIIEEIKARGKRGDAPTQMLVADHWGTLHAPFAVARNFFFDNEKEYADLRFVIHSSFATGQLLNYSCDDIFGKRARGPEDKSAHVTRDGMKLGIEILKHPHSEFLTIEAIRDGRIKEWNAANPNVEVVVGSKILSVDGQTSSEEMIKSIKESDSFELIFRTPF